MGYSHDPGSYGYPPFGPPRRRRGRHAISHLTVAVLAALAAVLITLQVHSGNGSGNLPGPGAVPAPASSAAAPAGGSAATADVQQAERKVGPGVVLINTTLQYSSEAAAGTGMVINSDGLVLTNNHVIAGATKITAKVMSTGKTYPATVVGYDRTGDIALIRLQGASGLATVPLGNSTAVRTGNAVVALGNAGGQGTVVPAAGQVTGLNQTITAADESGTASTETLHGMIETNAQIVPGDSGGPLVSSANQIIGMDTAANSVSTGQQGASTGYAIPVNTALSVARQIAAGQASSTVVIGYPPFIGILIGSSSSSSPQAQAQQQGQQSGFGDGTGGFGGFNGYGGSGSQQSCYTSNTGLTVPSTIAPASSGTLIDGVICSSPAATAGITAGSVITEINGQQAGSPTNLTGILAKFRPGDTISVTWVSPSGHQSASKLRLAQGPPQ